jgi:hypothetical protein
MIARSALLLLLIVTPLGAGPASAAETAERSPSSPACFEIAAGRAAGQVSGTILLNRCTGQSWMLTKIEPTSGVSGDPDALFKWTPIGSDTAQAASPPASAPARRRTAARPVEQKTGKCFTFQGRQYCE